MVITWINSHFVVLVLFVLCSIQYCSTVFSKSWGIISPLFCQSTLCKSPLVFSSFCACGISASISKVTDIQLAGAGIHCSWYQQLYLVAYSEHVYNFPDNIYSSFPACDMPPGVPCINTGLQVIDDYAFNPSHLSSDFGYLGLLYLLFHVLGFIGLYLRVRRK